MSRTRNGILKDNVEKFQCSFSFGKGIALHNVGDIAVLEYHPFIYDGCRGTDKIDEQKTEFHIVGSHVSCNALDVAIVHALAIKYSGVNQGGGNFIVKAFDNMKEPHADWKHILARRD